MSRRALAGSTAMVGGILILACLAASYRPPEAPADDGKKPSPEEVFGLSRVWAVHLDITTAEYQALQPTGGFGFGRPPQPPAKDKGKKEKRPRDRNLFGIEFPWIHGNLTVAGKTYKKVGLRYDGNATYFASSLDIKRPFRIELNRHHKQHVHGMAL